MSHELLEDAEISRGQKVIELYDTDDGEAITAYAYVGHVTMNPTSSWAYISHGAVEAHLSSPDLPLMAVDNKNAGTDTRIVDKSESLFAGEDQ